jgi:hypothetical protein
MPARHRNQRSADTPPEDDPEAPLYTSEPVETEDGTVVVQQQNVGKDNMKGGGEWPDPDTPPEQ